MRAALAVIALTPLLSPLPAVALDQKSLCKSLGELLFSAKIGFDDIKSTTASHYIEGQAHYLALVTLPETSVCYISIGPEATLTCEYYTGILPRAEELNKELNSRLRQCLVDHIRGPVSPFKDDGNVVEFRTDERGAVTLDNSDLFGKVVKVNIRQVIEQ